MTTTVSVTGFNILQSGLAKAGYEVVRVKRDEDMMEEHLTNDIDLFLDYIYEPERDLCSETLTGRGFQPIEQMNEGAGNEDSKNL
jgi:hypothetical protein